MVASFLAGSLLTLLLPVGMLVLVGLAWWGLFTRGSGEL
jgi:hypothetical protein